MNSILTPFYAQSLAVVGAKVQTVKDCRAIGGVRQSIMNSGTIERLTRTQVIVRNQHGNIQRHRIDNGAAIGTGDTLCPTFIVILA